MEHPMPDERAHESDNGAGQSSAGINPARSLNAAAWLETLAALEIEFKPVLNPDPSIPSPGQR
jgi:hypothetical protein